MKSYKKYLTYTLIIFLSLQIPLLAEESDRIKEYRKTVVAVIQTYIGEIFKTSVDEKKVVDDTDTKYKCSKCKDTKFITHGDGHKTPCPFCSQSGDSAPMEKQSLYFYKVDGCQHCKQWEIQEKPLLKDLYNIVEIDETTSPRRKFNKYPGFEIKYNNKTVQFTGYLSKNLLEKINEQHNR